MQEAEISVIVKGKNSGKQYTVRYWADGKQREKSFCTSGEAKAFKEDIDRASRYRSGSVLLSAEASEIPVNGTVYAVYRLWNAAGNCLYVGKSAQVHPILRVISHRSKAWWGEVARADFITVAPESLDRAELDQIAIWVPKYNKVRRGWAAG